MVCFTSNFYDVSCNQWYVYWSTEDGGSNQVTTIGLTTEIIPQHLYKLYK